MHDAVTDWLDAQARRGRSESTIRTYRSVLSGWHPDPLTATLADAQAWWEAQDGDGPRTRAKRLAAVRSFYTWAVRHDLVDRDPTRRLDAPTLPKGAPRYVTRHQLDTLLRELPGDLRRAVVLGAWAGLRVSEAAALDWSDIDTEARRLTVRGKGDKERPVGVGGRLLDELLPVTGGNVVTAGGQTYSAGVLQRRVNRYLEAQGIDGTFHKLRARFVTVALAEGVPLLSVSRAVGHSSPTTTALYALTADADLDLIAEAVSR